jgi:hypothetical protein
MEKAHLREVSRRYIFRGMRILLATALAVITCSTGVAQDRFAPGNPYYADFERDCRRDDPGNPMAEECQGGVEDAWRNFSGSKNVDCDYGAYWLVSDDMKLRNDKYFDVLPWQYGVEAVVGEGGVCRVVAD